MCYSIFFLFFLQAEDGIRYLVRSRGLGDVYKRQDDKELGAQLAAEIAADPTTYPILNPVTYAEAYDLVYDIRDRILDACLLYTSDAADERSSVDLGGRRIIKKTTRVEHGSTRSG